MAPVIKFRIVLDYLTRDNVYRNRVAGLYFVLKNQKVQIKKVSRAFEFVLKLELSPSPIKHNVALFIRHLFLIISFFCLQNNFALYLDLYVCCCFLFRFADVVKHVCSL